MYNSYFNYLRDDTMEIYEKSGNNGIMHYELRIMH